ncbi:MAG: N-glycosylase/DNA lyase [Deltaproteobacteria bacterium]|nr:MAG: N-glycosylase/DNA lyase [Deltaproteobacteria bacterium]UCH07599.1 MAG: N-glycosylase/DNA lyase [Deltaproteobacteria bacterium]
MSRFAIKQDRVIQGIKDLYEHKRAEICSRLDEFKEMWQAGTEEQIFCELVFCILTPMARGAMCSKAVENMTRSGILFKGNCAEIAKELTGARFINKKAAYIVEARDKILHGNPVSLRSILGKINDGYQAREWLVRHVKGIGYKEAGHFLRNIGFNQDLAILDRHILKNLKKLAVIDSFPDSLSRRQYLTIEVKMQEFSEAVHIPMSHLDFVLWYKETGEILK